MEEARKLKKLRIVDQDWTHSEMYPDPEKAVKS